MRKLIVKHVNKLVFCVFLSLVLSLVLLKGFSFQLLAICLAVAVFLRYLIYLLTFPREMSDVSAPYFSEKMLGVGVSLNPQNPKMRGLGMILMLCGLLVALYALFFQ